MSNKKSKNLNNYLNKVIEHKTLSCIIALLMFVLPLIVVHFLFKWNSNIEWIQAEWDAGDVISYIAGFEAFIGTTFLSFLALWQNQQHKQENEVIKWSKEDKQNMKYIISKLGYDPFEDVGLDDFDRKYCFNLFNNTYILII